VVLDDADGLSPDEAALMALSENPRLRAKRAERGLAEAEIVRAGLLPNPRLDVSVSDPTAGRDATVLGYGAGISWNVTPLLSRSQRLAAAKEHGASVDLEIAWEEWQVANAAHLHAVRVIFLERRVRITRKIETALARRLDGVRAAREADALTEEEVVRREQALSEARIRRLDLEEQLGLERASLARSIGYDARLEPTMQSTWEPPRASPDAEGTLEALPGRRLDLLALQRAERSGDHALQAAILARFPAIDIGIETSRDVDRLGAAGLTLSIGLPFFDRNQAEIARARATRAEVEAEYEARLATARAEVVRILRALPLVAREEAAAAEATETATRLADRARTAETAGSLSPARAAELRLRSLEARLRQIRIEQSRAEILDALALASGILD